MKIIETLKNVWKITELKDRIILTLGLLLVYRFGAQVVLPGIDASKLGVLGDNTDSGLLGLLNAFTGGAFALHFCIYCCSINGNCNSLSAKTSKRRRKWKT